MARTVIRASSPQPGIVRCRFVIRGTVQGVGFRPFLYRRATRLKLGGWVGNTSGGLTLEVEGPPATVERFVTEMRRDAPPLARLGSLQREAVAATGARDFRIVPSDVTAGGSTGVLPDLATCADCLAEIADPAGRRFRYPFTSCVNCGPRYSILRELPYDRCRTTMATFPLCTSCRAEYEDPADRRFHAETIACPHCGPTLAWRRAAGGEVAFGEQAMQAALQSLRAGQVVALKGLGGYQLLVDAGNEQAVALLRSRKQRPDKPFALLVRDMDEARRLCPVGTTEAELLQGPEAPIVLLRRRGEAGPIARSVAPENPWLGLMLPCTPLHHLLARGAGGPLVATSGNLADAPILYDDDAPCRLQGVADGFLVHDRAILHPVDDSVMRTAAGHPLLLRRARGFAPARVPTPGIVPGIVGTGGHLKNTVALSMAGEILVGPHVGDLETTDGRSAHRRGLELLATLAGATRVAAVARDMHPDYAAGAPATWPDADRVAVQHHVAHVAACIAEHRLRGPVLGVAWDGAGFGPDGTLWGGEFLQLDGADWRRLAHFRPFRLPGGAMAVREPWRAALGVLFAAFGRSALTPHHLPTLQLLPEADQRVLVRALESGLNAPLTSSAGRLFDAVAALLGLRARGTYEGHAASTLEWAAADWDPEPGYAFDLVGDLNSGSGPVVLDFAPALQSLLHDRDGGVAPGLIARRWHDGLARLIVTVARAAGIAQVALVGGCFQNRILLEAAAGGLAAAGMQASWPRRIPPNDGGLSLGQVLWASRLRGGSA